ncbi:MAG: hypothetical protein MJY95_04335 [Bacteroidaceae bacterium]|nr:hypothetical protein [Bacteroidaceae bacterium]
MKKLLSILTMMMAFAIQANAQFIFGKEAPVTVAGGISLSRTIGDDWNSDEISGGVVDATLHNIYIGASFEHYRRYAYIYDSDIVGKPFDNIRGKICGRYYKLKGGYCFPLRSGTVWLQFSPYIGAGLMHLRPFQKNVRKLDCGIDPSSFITMGPGIKTQISIKFFTMGVSYEHQFYLSKYAPDAMTTFTATVGYMF